MNKREVFALLLLCSLLFLTISNAAAQPERVDVTVSVKYTPDGSQWKSAPYADVYGFNYQHLGTTDANGRLFLHYQNVGTGRYRAAVNIRNGPGSYTAYYADLPVAVKPSSYGPTTITLQCRRR